ncbi:MAG: hypothetical protein MMC23_005016 [Stictis urceolatum]|nr:hypothetical protein [Stictis urceolata]
MAAAEAASLNVAVEEASLLDASLDTAPKEVDVGPPLSPPVKADATGSLPETSASSTTASAALGTSSSPKDPK